MDANQTDSETLVNIGGSYCVYRERGFLLLVKVTDVQVSDWGVLFSFEVVQESGFKEQGKKTFEASCCWDFLRLSDKKVYASMVGWALLFRNDMVIKFKKIASECSDDRELYRSFSRLTFDSDSDSDTFNPTGLGKIEFAHNRRLEICE